MAAGLELDKADFQARGLERQLQQCQGKAQQYPVNRSVKMIAMAVAT